MTEILQNKNSATRFQILVEIAASGTDVQQKRIAQKLGITPQAVSDYMHQMVSDELLETTSRSHYKISTKGVNWVLKVLRELRAYSSFVEQAVTNITVCAAIAESDIEGGQPVGLKMKNGLLYATPKISGNAKGVALSSVKKEEDLDVSNIEGLIEIDRGKITILQVPVVQKGGSKHVNMDLLKTHIADNPNIGAIGIEAMVSLKRLDIEPRYLYGVSEAAIESVQCGLPFIIVCTEDAIAGLFKKLQEENLNYELIDIRK
ncbi:MAG: winged helix-turn-helix transcriptional regulator [Dehalococcoidia bacterium]